MYTCRVQPYFRFSATFLCCTRYKEICGVDLDPIAIFDRASRTGSLTEIEEVMVYGADEGGDFDKFDIGCYFPLCVTGYYLDRNEHDAVIRRVVERHKREGISYIEYRQGVGYSDEFKEEWKDWHKRFMKYLKKASTERFEAKYILRLSGNPYNAVKELVAENPDLSDVLVGLDFSGKELPPKTHRRFFERLREEKNADIDTVLDVVVHIGEVFFDKSMESAIRWCHETAEFGVARLGHCTALGLDPEIAVKRRGGAHTEETLSERLDQVEYDLKYERHLQDRGVKIEKDKLLKEKEALMGRNPHEMVRSAYDEGRIAELRKRQDFVLERIKELGTVIETCPTSNLRIGGIPDMTYHPFKKFYEFGLNIAICTDDPGIFKTSLSDEVDLISKTFDIDTDELAERLGDPYEHRLGKHRRP